jgi:hypothetical protein
MYVVDVIPFSRSAPPGTLSYRSRTELPEGTVVEVSLRRKHVQGLVVSCQSVAEAKATLKNASFLLTKDVPHIVGSLPDALRDAAHKTAEYHAATLGSTLAALLGEQARSDVSLVHPLSAGTGFVIDTTEHTVDERASAYEALIASATENGAATLLVVPTLAEIEYWKQTLASWKPVVLSGALVGRKREDALAASVSGARLIIATPMFELSSNVPVQAAIVCNVARISICASLCVSSQRHANCLLPSGICQCRSNTALILKHHYNQPLKE